MRVPGIVGDFERFIEALEPSQPSLLKDIRLHLAKVSEAMDDDLIDAALAFADWMRAVQLPDMSTCPSGDRPRHGFQHEAR